MNKRTNGGSKPPSRAIALAVGVWLFSGSAAMSSDDGPPAPAPAPVQKGQKWGKFFHNPRASSKGTLGYGAPGLYPGFQGFGLGYHPGYGYGGEALGVGAGGGYPSFGGPGYLHPSPCLDRLGPIATFRYFGGPGSPSPGQPQYFGEVGPLAPDQPVVTFEGDSPEAGFANGYGAFTGTIPYPESTFGPSSSPSVGAGSSVGANPPPPARSTIASPTAGSTRRE